MSAARVHEPPNQYMCSHWHIYIKPQLIDISSLRIATRWIYLTVKKRTLLNFGLLKKSVTFMAC